MMEDYTETQQDQINPKPSGYRLLTDAELDEIHLASLEILRRTGVHIPDTEVLELLQDAGCVVIDDNIVHFPAAVIEDALLYVPSRVVVSDRTGKPRMYLEAHRCYFGTGSDLPYTRDLKTGERRPSLLSDVGDAARLVDSLPNLDFVMSMALPSDIRAEISDRYSFLAMLENSIKPIVFTAWDEGGLKDIINMAEVIAGDGNKLSLSPFLVAYLEPTSPLKISETVLRKMILMVDRGLPFVYAPGPIEGASAPVTSAGSLALANAEILAGLVIAQFRRRGTPFLSGSGSGPMDMKSMILTCAAPECLLHCMAIAELAHYYYNIPVFGFSGVSESKLPDIQAGIESALWILWTALSGANLVHDIGYIESGMTCSYEMVVICDEIIDFVRQLLRGIDFTPEQLALDVINDVGPGGSFLKEVHTAKHYREVWYPRIFDRKRFDKWVENGEPEAIRTAREIAIESISNHKVTPISDSVRRLLTQIIKESEDRLEKKREKEK